jgi:glycosyltransferase involved in cell wall biosynthesis
MTILHQMLPSSVRAGIRRLRNGPEFTGDYSSWSAASNAAEGFNVQQLVDKVRSAALKAKNGTPAFERDSENYLSGGRVREEDRGNISHMRSPRIKIAVIFGQVPQAGGAFHQSINAVEQFKRVCGDAFEIQLFHTGIGGAVWLNEIGQESTPLRETWTSKIVEAILHYAPRSISRRIELISPREKFLILHGIDLVYFTSPNTLALSLQKLKYIATHYDICHRDFPEFPETADFAKFQSCEAYNWQVLAKAILVLVDSKLLMSQVSEIYGIQQDRLLVMPYGVSHYIQKGSADGATLRRKYQLHAPFLFYPAQFWAHKNHARILQALHLLKERGHVVDVAFAGSDKGERAHLEATAVRTGLADQVHFLGFVPSEDLAGLYSESLALVMPTYFGPTNIPPLEAWSLDIPVIYSKHLSAGIEEGVLAIDSDVAESIADAIERVTDERVRRDLIAGGRRCLERVNQDIATSEGSLREHVVRFARRRETWASSPADPSGTKC